MTLQAENTNTPSIQKLERSNKPNILQILGASLNPQLMPLLQQQISQERKASEEVSKRNQSLLKILIDSEQKALENPRTPPEVIEEIRSKRKQAEQTLFGGSVTADLPQAEEQFVSTEGKRLSDRQRVLSRYGEGSEQLKRFDDSLVKANKPGSLVNLQLPGGRIVTLRQDSPRVDELLASGAIKIGTGGESISIKSGDTELFIDRSGNTRKVPTLGSDKVTNRKRREQIDATVDVLNSAQRIISLADQAGAKGLSVSGFVNSLADSFVAQANAVAETAGVDIGKLETPEGIKKIAGDNARLQNRFKALAISIATSEQGSRPSDKDVQNALDRIGGSVGSVNQLKAAIEEETLAAIKRANNAGRTIELFDDKFTFREYAKGRDVDANFIDSIGGGKNITKDPSQMTDEEILEALTK